MAFIVLEGLDGAGKSTQVKKLKKRLAAEGKEYIYIHFPRFDTPIYGELIARFLRGELGSVESVNPYLVALIYAGDRRVAAEGIRKALNEGKTVIVDRYVSSNIAYQCAKLPDGPMKEELRKWIWDMEYRVNGIPRPDITLFLDVPFEFTRQSLKKERFGDDREYLKGKEDIHEASLNLQQAVRNVYLSENKKDDRFHVVNCSDSNGVMAGAENIFNSISNCLGDLL